MSFKKVLEMKIARTTYEITEYPNAKVSDFLKDLDQVPYDAVMQEWYAASDDSGVLIMKFVCEIENKEQK